MYLRNQDVTLFRRRPAVGSSGTNSFSDYPGSSRGSRTHGGGGGTGGAGNPEQNECEQPIQTQLEEVATCDYYRGNATLPPVSTPISLRSVLVSGRLGIEDSAGVLIGYLPTALNHLRQCMERGYSFRGHVTSTTTAPLPSVTISLSHS